LRSVLVFGLGACLAVIGGYFAYVQLTKPPFALEVDATRDTTDISGVFYRIRVTNVGTERLTGVTAELGVNDIQQLPFLEPGHSYFFYPEPETKESRIRVITNEGVEVETDYRSPTKVLGLPGAGR
jgi:hypothetical protein